MKKKILIALIACMTFTAFAGCNSSDGGDSKSSGTVNVSTAAEESQVSVEESKQESHEDSKQESKEESKEESKKENNESSIPGPVEVSEHSTQESSDPEVPQESSEEYSEAEEPSEESSYDQAESSEELSEVSEIITGNGSFSESDLSFVYNGAQIAPDDGMSSVIDSIGEAQDVRSVPSCIGVGEDKIYTYSGFKIESYPDEAGEKVLNITIESASAATPKGVKVGMTADDVKTAYGTDSLDPSSDEYILIYRSGSRHLDFLIENGVIFEIDYVLDV